MPIGYLTVLPFASSPTAFDNDLDDPGLLRMTPHGDADAGTCVRDTDDGKYLSDDPGGQVTLYFQNTSGIPMDAHINSVTCQVRHRNTGSGTVTNPPQVFWWLVLAEGINGGYYSGVTGWMLADQPTGVFSYADLTPPLTTHLYSKAGDPILLSQLLNDGDAGSPYNGHGAWTFGLSSSDVGYEIDQFRLVVDYALSSSTWWFNPTANRYVFAEASPGAPFVASETPPTITITGVSPRSI